jgi:hypothetical protein
VPLETEDDVLKGNNVLLIIRSIPLEMNIDTAAAQLGTEIPARKQVIRSDQHVDTASETGQGFDAIQLVSKPTTAGNLREMLGFVNENR